MNMITTDAPESSEAKDGAWVGITGENIDIADDI